MKKLVGTDFGSYTFSPTTNKITINVAPSNYQIGLQQILLITDVSYSGGAIILYNFGIAALGGSIANNVITLNYNCSALSSTDTLQIYVDVEFYEESLHALLRRMNKLLESNATIDSQQRQKVAIDAIGTAGTLAGTVPVAGAVTIAAGVGASIAGNNQSTVYSLGSVNTNQVTESPVDQRWRIADDCHRTYGAALRSQLSW
jgi:hypothetical protein